MRDVVSNRTVGVAGAKDLTAHDTSGALPHARELHGWDFLLCFITTFHVRSGTSETCRSLSGQGSSLQRGRP